MKGRKKKLKFEREAGEKKNILNLISPPPRRIITSAHISIAFAFGERPYFTFFIQLHWHKNKNNGNNKKKKSDKPLLLKSPRLAVQQ